MHELNWGSVPAWFGAASLFLAFRVFLRDRGASDRAQINQVAVWCIVKEHPSLADRLHLKWYYHNASNLPVQIIAAYYSVKVSWVVPSKPNDRGGMGVTSEPLPTNARAATSAGILPPGETVEEFGSIYIDDVRPTPHSFPYPPNPGECAIDRILIIDNTGRRWDFQPLSGRFARQVRIRHLMLDWHDELRPLHTQRQSAIVYSRPWYRIKHGVLLGIRRLIQKISSSK